MRYVLKNLIFIITVFSLFITLILFGNTKSLNTPNKTIGLIERMDINNIDMALENNGATGNDGQTYYPNGQSSLSVLFQGGFFVTAYVNGELRSSSMALSSLINEWQPGMWGMDPTDPLAKFYVVNSADSQGSAAYIDWNNAVNMGADFQDLDGNGVYSPYIDKPDILGDRTIWFPISDSTSIAQRTPFLQTLPIGLEMNITVWAVARTDELGDIIFFRYRLLNSADTLKNDVLFSVWTDPDIGDCDDDLIGCDSSLSLGYSYNDADDPLYGANPPAFGIQMLQGPIVHSIGDTAYNYRGPYFGIDSLYDSKNVSQSSFMFYRSGSPIIPNPANVQTARYYQIGGLDGNGSPLDPTYWGIGGTSTTNPKYVFSGNPLTGTGWLDNVPDDKRFLINFGPFDLDINEKQDIIIAYIVAQGNNALESVELLKTRAAVLKGLYPISGIGKVNNTPPINFNLSQNYPNPFNPTTTIKYQLPKLSDVSIQIFNVLGQQVSNLIKKRQQQGTYELTWNGLNDAGIPVSSGIYIYQLQTDKYATAKKMLLIR